MRASVSAIASWAMSSAAACSCIWWTAPPRTRRRPIRRSAAELAAYGHGLLDKPELVALSKADAMSSEDIKQQTARLKRAAKSTPWVISAVSGDGVKDLLRAALKVIEQATRGAAEQPAGDAAWHPWR